MEKKWIVTGLLLLITGIMLGAFGAHGLKRIIHDADWLVSFETGVRYQLIHGVAFLSVPFILKHVGFDSKWAYRLLLIGVMFFSGSLYLLSLRFSLVPGSFKMLGPVTPIGGLLLIIGWTILLAGVVRKR